MGECALWSTGPQFAAQVAAAVSLVEAPANHRKATTVAKEVMAIMPGNRTSLSIEKFLESPFSGKQPKLIEKSTKAAAAEAAVTAAEAIAVADLEEAKRLAAEFEAICGSARAGRQDFRATDQAGIRDAEPPVCKPALAQGGPRVQPPDRAPW